MTKINEGLERCVICGEDVEVFVLVSLSNFSGVELDLRPRGPARFAEKNFVHYCPKCGYASFNLEKDITMGNRDILETEEYKKIVEDVMLPDDAKKFYLVGIILENNNELQRAATAYLRASWFFGDFQYREWMLKAKRKAINCLIQSDFTWKNEQVIATLVDMYRRIGEFDKAIETIHTFGLENVGNETNKKILLYQLELCKAKDTAVHTSREI